jgi:hypothetical protein
MKYVSEKMLGVILPKLKIVVLYLVAYFEYLNKVQLYVES